MYGRDRYPELFELLEEMYELLNRKHDDLAFLSEANLRLRELSRIADVKRRIARKPKPKQ